MSDLTYTGSVHSRDLTVDVEDVRTVELCAANAWPAQNTSDLEGWTVRYSPGVSNRRANSVLPLTYRATRRLHELVAEVDRFYSDRNLPARFMVSPAALPDDIDAELEALGYHIDAPTKVQWAITSDVIACCPAPNRVEASETPTPEWMASYMEGVDDRQEIAIKTLLIERIKPKRVLAQINEHGRPVAVGLSVCERGWAGVFCMHTLVSHRRKGLARHLLGGLAHWAREQGAERMYLQVECDNTVAQRFYESCGFETQYGYHYRTKETKRVS